MYLMLKRIVSNYVYSQLKGTYRGPDQDYVYPGILESIGPMMSPIGNGLRRTALRIRRHLIKALYKTSKKVIVETSLNILFYIV